MPVTVPHLPEELAGHAVLLSDVLGEVGASAAPFLAGAVAAGEGAVAVVRPELGAVLEQELAARGIDAAAARAEGRLLVLDAASTLASLRPAGPLDGSVVVGRLRELVEEASAGGTRPVRVFGEMVALLWDLGEVADALLLESLWNEVAGERDLRVLCAYPAAIAADHTDAFRDMCALHCHVVAPDDGEVAADVPHRASRRFRATTGAPAAARAYVVATLERWGRGGMVDAAELIVSELATNAVLHARSSFTVALTASDPDDAAVRLEVRDDQPALPRRSGYALDAGTGRGLHLIDALAVRWGAEADGRGKVVWVELAADG